MLLELRGEAELELAVGALKNVHLRPFWKTTMGREHFTSVTSSKSR